MAEYRLLTTWRFAAPLQQVFDLIFDSLQWPAWWPGADHVEQFEAGDDNGIGSIRHYVWKGKLPYRLRFNARATRIEPMQILEANVSGDLEGRGRWTFSHDSGITTVQYEWDVHTTRRWMNLAAPVARAAFTGNHHALMQNGAEGLARQLNARLLEASCRVLPSVASNNRSLPINRVAAIGAGIAAGTVATFVQMGLWWAASYSPYDMLLRDTRLAAAILLGRSILAPPASFDWIVLLVATLVHFALSIVYGLLQAPLVSRLAPLPSAIVGGVFGLFLFGMNMYGFTVLFPWFEASRDWITAAAHAAFGVTAAVIYRFWESRAATFRQQLIG
jgi:uncharacterized protein YndB with AHSA1/START domain